MSDAAVFDAMMAFVTIFDVDMMQKCTVMYTKAHRSAWTVHSLISMHHIPMHPAVCCKTGHETYQAVQVLSL